MSRALLPFVLYGVVAVIAAMVLRPDFRLGVFILLGALAIKTWVGQQKNRGTTLGPDESTRESEGSEGGGEA